MTTNDDAKQIDDGTSGTAFPQKLDLSKITEAGAWAYLRDASGLTPRQYAAIHLKVPDSKTEWLDDMIRESLRDEWAGQAMCSMTEEDWSRAGAVGVGGKVISTACYQWADDMLAERRRREGGESDG